MKPILIPCWWDGRHRWETVEGAMSTPEHQYFERRCKKCRQYESEVR